MQCLEFPLPVFLYRLLLPLFLSYCTARLSLDGYFSSPLLLLFSSLPRFLLRGEKFISSSGRRCNASPGRFLDVRPTNFSLVAIFFFFLLPRAVFLSKEI